MIKKLLLSLVLLIGLTSYSQKFDTLASKKFTFYETLKDTLPQAYLGDYLITTGLRGDSAIVKIKTFKGIDLSTEMYVIRVINRLHNEERDKSYVNYECFDLIERAKCIFGVLYDKDYNVLEVAICDYVSLVIFKIEINPIYD